jgi:pimeloyl-ACP methyl ester carboxylesterase
VEVAMTAWRVRDATRPLLVLGPSLGTSVEALWCDVVPHLHEGTDVVGWDLPGHGRSSAAGLETWRDLTIEVLVDGLLRGVARAQAARGDDGAPFWYAGVSVGGAVGLRLLVDSPRHLHGAALICTAARFGEPAPWRERAELVARAGTPTQVVGSARRWFGPGFVEGSPEVVTRLLGALQETDRWGYAAVCGALARFDATAELGRLAAGGPRVLGIAGAADTATPPALLAEIVSVAPGARLEVLDGVAHLAPAERPRAVARLVQQLVEGKVSV